ncbi:Uncharacterised protein [Bergeriella denitrificans]|uniref:Uncharacterized protein n=1 Tax=Bergeriella denitrificans TaxID=494 RepID=A0A378UTY1_BERDE|nr:Uncharacterised protein [Bergeriella denitrificans]
MPVSFITAETMLFQLFWKTVSALPIEIGISAAFCANDSEAPEIALKITSAVSLPSLPSFLISARLFAHILGNRIKQNRG